MAGNLVFTMISLRETEPDLRVFWGRRELFLQLWHPTKRSSSCRPPLQRVYCAPVSRELRKEHEVILIHIRQHYDPEMLDVFRAEIDFLGFRFTNINYEAYIRYMKTPKRVRCDSFILKRRS